MLAVWKELIQTSLKAGSCSAPEPGTGIKPGIKPASNAHPGALGTQSGHWAGRSSESLQGTGIFSCSSASGAQSSSGARPDPKGFHTWGSVGGALSGKWKCSSQIQNQILAEPCWGHRNAVAKGEKHLIVLCTARDSSNITERECHSGSGL